MAGDDPTIDKSKRVAQTARVPCVRVVRSPDPIAAGMAFDLDGTTWTFGRHKVNAAIQDLGISRLHLKLMPAGATGRYFVEDLGTKNGSFRNGHKLKTAATVELGDVLALGDTLLVVDGARPGKNQRLSDAISGHDVTELVGSSFAAQTLRRWISQVAPAPGSVLLLGPTGAGKEVCARALHRLGKTPDGPFISENCANLDPQLATSTLFGHKKGAFTGAERDREGLFKLASGGTLFLDEVGELPPSVQSMLLRVLQDGVVKPLGASVEEKVEVRTIFATHVDLERSGFRKDLRARMEWTINVPPLAERRADVLALFRHFLREEAPSMANTPSTAEFDEALLLYDWSENVREVRRLARQLAYTAEGVEQLDLDHLWEPIQRPLWERYGEEEPEDGAPPIAEDTDDVSREEKGPPSKPELEVMLARTEGNVSEIARELGAHKNQVYRWLAKYDLDAKTYRRLKD